jgi:hypothetical protein
MPIEIKELVIRAVVSPQHGGGGGGGGCSSGRAESTGGGGQDFDAIVQACVDETLRILRRQRER